MTILFIKIKVECSAEQVSNLAA